MDGALLLDSDTSSASMALDDGVATDCMYFIGELLPIVGFEPKTIRFYEKAGLLSPERHGRIRIYRRKDVLRLRAIKFLREYGMPISKIRSILEIQGDLSIDTITSPFIQKVMAEQLVELNKRHAKLQMQIAELQSKLGQAA